MSHTEQPTSPDQNGGQSREQETDAAVLARYVAGDDEGLVLLVRRHERLLRHVARQVVHDECETEDVVQSAWIAVINGVAGFRGGSAVEVVPKFVELRDNLARTPRLRLTP